MGRNRTVLRSQSDEGGLEVSDCYCDRCQKLREQFPGAGIQHNEPAKALRYNSGKPALDYLLTFPEALKGVAAVSSYGEQKYERYNYLKGAPASESVSSLLRHLLAWHTGEDNDSESKLSHLAHVAWNALRLCDEMARTPIITDDRPKQVIDKS